MDLQQGEILDSSASPLRFSCFNHLGAQVAFPTETGSVGKSALLTHMGEDNKTSRNNVPLHVGCRWDGKLKLKWNSFLPNLHEPLFPTEFLLVS